jgi:tRNA-binding protein
MAELIEWDDFTRVVMLAGTVTRAEAFPEAKRPAYRIWVDFGSFGELKTSAQVTGVYQPGDLVGKQVIGVVNFPEKQIGPIRSQFLLTGFHTEEGVVIATTERTVPNGTRLA